MEILCISDQATTAMNVVGVGNEIDRNGILCEKKSGPKNREMPIQLHVLYFFFRRLLQSPKR